MSFSSGGKVQAIFSPLESSLTVFTLKDRKAAIYLARLVLEYLTNTHSRSLIIDIDALYGSRMVNLGRRPISNSISLLTPLTDSKAWEWLVESFINIFDRKVILIDNLNSLFHLLSLDDPNSAGNKLAIVLEFLAFLTRTQKKTIFATLYKRDIPFVSRRGKGIPNKISDMIVSVEIYDNKIYFEAVKGTPWGSTFSYIIPL